MFLLFYFYHLQEDAMKKLTAAQLTTLTAKIASRRRSLEAALQGLVQGYTTAAFIWGPPGLGKSHVVRTYLDGAAGKTWIHHTAYTTAKGLMLTLAEQPHNIHVFEDCERVLKNDLCASILRAAAGSSQDEKRWITYETANEKLRVNFTGAIVIVTNANLSKTSGPMQGVASRFRPVKWDLTIEERIALILEIATLGYSRNKVTVSAAECVKVANRLMELVADTITDVALDLRLFIEHAMPAYAQWKAEKSGPSWEDVLITKLSGVAGTDAEHREEKMARLEQLALTISVGGGTSKEKIARWRAATNLGQAIFYRHLRKAK
jgi:hypothetical protein